MIRDSVSIIFNDTNKHRKYLEQADYSKRDPFSGV